MKIPSNRIVETTAPTTPVVSNGEAKAQLRIDHATENDAIDRMVETARLKVEEIAGRALITRTYTARLDAWPPGAVIELPYPPLIAVTSIKYTDANGDEATFDAANYHVDTHRDPGRIVLRSTANWPGVELADINGVEIVWTAGYGSAAAAVPENYRQAVLLYVGHLYENREAVTVAQGVNITELPDGFRNLVFLNRASWF